jgi:hypothetical protein
MGDGVLNFFSQGKGQAKATLCGTCRWIGQVDCHGLVVLCFREGKV